MARVESCHTKTYSQIISYKVDNNNNNETGDLIWGEMREGRDEMEN